MFLAVTLVVLVLSSTHRVVGDSIDELLYKDEYRDEVDKWLNEIDADFHEFNALSAQITWGLSVGSNDGDDLLTQGLRLGVARNLWKNNVCQTNIHKDLLDFVQRRKLYLFCRGPKYNKDLTDKYTNLMTKLSLAYSEPICMNDINKNVLSTEVIKLFEKSNGCLSGEPDLEMIMKRQDLSAEQLKEVWLIWHDWVGPRVKQYYGDLVQVQNEAARDNGYEDIGQAWRSELEVPNLEREVFNLYDDIQPIYVMLHAVVRHSLYLKYGPEKVDRNGLLPIHLLGNMWGQDWSPLINLFNFANATVDLNANIKRKNWSVEDMVLRSEDMYTSIGLPKMTDKFWKYSKFEKNNSKTICHGTAGNLYKKHDYRMLLCAEVDMENFYIIHHEMGHIEYYMAYENASTFFQEGANTAFHESIGDSIMHAVMTPQHLYRLGLITDDQFRDKNTDVYLLLQQMLYRLPEIPFALLIDKYRWDLFSGKIPPDEYNNVYWEMNKRMRGIKPPRFRGEEFFDIGAKFHVPDNTPYIRYFLSSILQMEMFQGLCELTLFGKTLHQATDSYKSKNDLPLPLHRCDIYGSKNAGNKFKAMMKKGSKQHWSKTLEILTGKTKMTTRPFLEYYKPVIDWMKEYIDENDVTVGW